MGNCRCNYFYDWNPFSIFLGPKGTEHAVSNPFMIELEERYKEERDQRQEMLMLGNDVSTN